VAEPRPTAIVTGGARGIGLGISRALANTGWDLAVVGVRPLADVSGVLDELKAGGGRVHYTQADIGDARQRARIVAEVIDALGTPAALVNNAGRGPRVRADLLDASEESFEELVRTNLQGPYFLTQAVANAMLADRTAARRGIIFITSVSAEMASVQRGDYCVSKAGLSMAAKLFASRLAAEGIPVFEVRPGIIATDMTAGVKEKYDQRIADGLIPDPRWGTPDDVGAAVAMLLRGDVRYSTGSVLHVDGGLAIPRL
jgi:3-oxoacyl-[acyl-carrier protein] reductase